ncbi:HAMP domain-containing protein [bacterium]|nr:HAMP domain-containing protein [bacterium]
MLKFNQIKGSFVRRLANLFVFYGVVPALLVSSLSAIFLIRQNIDLTDSLESQLKLQTETGLVNTVETRALQYDEVFREKSRVAIQVANYLGDALQNIDQTNRNPNWDFEEQTYLHPSGWRINQDSAEFGFKMSPIATLNDDVIARQNAIAAVIPVLNSIRESDATIRTIFIISEDQTGWIYPNRFWDNGEFLVGTNPDFKSRSYYQKTHDVIWLNPYTDIEPGVTVITVIAPIWAGDVFSGIVGIDFSIKTFIEEVLQSEIGNEGFLFLVGEQGEVIALPQDSIGWLFPKDMSINLGGLLNKNLTEVVSDQTKAELLSENFSEKLTEKTTFLLDVPLEGGAAYIAVAPIESMRWNVAAVLPVSEVTGFADHLSILMGQNTSNVLLLLLVTGIGFFGVILLGALFNLKQLVLPIQALAQGAEEISRGNLSHRVPEDLGFDEVNTLSKNFNVMAKSIQAMQEDIESRRKALQQTLTEKEMEFDSINQIAEIANRQISLLDTVRTAVEIVKEALDSNYLVVSLVDADNHWIAAFSESPHWGKCKFEQIVAQNNFDDLWNTCTQTGLKEIDLSTLSPTAFPKLPYEELVALEGKTLFVAPIYSKGKLLGAFSLLLKQGEKITAQKASFIDTIIKHLSVLIENVQLQNLTRDLTIIEERRRLASEMHDSVTQSLFTIRLTAQGLKSACENDDKNQNAMDMLVDQIDFVQKEMRTLIHELRPIDHQTEDLFSILQGRIASFQRTAEIHVDFKTNGNPMWVSPIIKQNLSRITQEALSNIIKHARATSVTVDVKIKQDMVLLNITDNGVGYKVEEVLRKEGASLGLLSMRERAESLGGALLLRSEVGKGTSIIVKIPITLETEGNTNE